MNFIFNNISAKYPKNDHLILNLVSFRVKPRETLLIIGPSGAGKTSIIETIFRQTKVVSGSIYFNDQSLLNLGKTDFKNFCQNTAYLSQKINSFEEETVYNTLKKELLSTKKWYWQLLNWISQNDRLKILKILKQLKILKYSFVPLNQLSKGEVKRVEIAKLLLKKPRLIIADEPTNNLDIVNAIQVIKAIQKLAQTFNCPAIVVIHDLTLIKKLQAPLMAIRDGRVVFWDRLGQQRDNLIHQVYGQK